MSGQPVLTVVCSACGALKIGSAYVLRPRALAPKALTVVSHGICKPCIKLLYPGLRSAA
ncbi:MAG TPA: hypothetical protein VJ735_05930 [Actinomycetes bacterium]|nr:hypothetical protein [Actinomycetes bacterium]